VFTVVAVGGGVSAAASYSWTITPPPATAKLWISPAGSDSTCVRSSTPIDYATALKNGNVCATGPVAYQRASLGDTILTQTMTVSSQWAFGRTITKSVPDGTCDYNYGGTANLSNCITIEPAPGQSIRFSVAGNNQPQIRVCVSGLSIQNLTIQDTTFTDGFGDAVSNAALVQGSGDNTCGTSAPHDDYYVNVTFGGPLDILGGSYNTWVVGGTQTGTHEMSSQFAGLGNNGAIPAMHGSGEVGITWEGYNFINLDPGHHHAECVHVDGSESNEVFAGNRFEQCPVESLFFETESGSQTGNLIENNYFDPGNGGGPLKFACRQPGCVESNNIIRFNSFAGPWQIACEASSGACNIDNNVFYGNLKIGCVPLFTNGATIVGTGFVDQGYNVQGAAKANTCTSNTSSYLHAIQYAASGAPNYNLDLSGTTSASGYVPSSVAWPANHANIHGTARSGPSTDAGAY